VKSVIRPVVAILLVGAIVAGCGFSGTPILANPTFPVTAPPTATPPAARPADPVAIELPRDDGPHDRLTEWWYYTGHLVAADGRLFGFEAVIFRAERGAVPVTWASHLALTDETAGRFLYAQRTQVGPAADRSPRDAAGTPTGFDLAVVGFDPADPSSVERVPWHLAGGDGVDRVQAGLSPTEATAAGGSFGLDLGLRSTKPPALHDGIGWIDFGPAGGSYYYSRTRMAVTGILALDGSPLSVTGTAWFDHQWGDFISVGGGGWDWFALNLDDGTDLMFSIVRDADRKPVLVYGTRVDAVGAVTHLDATGFAIDGRGLWGSPRTGITYPSGWTIDARQSLGLLLNLRSTVDDQELDTRPTTGVVYWEGSNVVSGSKLGQAAPVSGEAYVELTGYGP